MHITKQNIQSCGNVNIQYIYTRQDTQKKFRHQVDAAGISQLSPLGHAAVKAAYVNGEEWYNGVIEYIGNNRKYVKEYTEKTFRA